MQTPHLPCRMLTGHPYPGMYIRSSSRFPRFPSAVLRRNWVLITSARQREPQWPLARSGDPLSCAKAPWALPAAASAVGESTSRDSEGTQPFAAPAPLWQAIHVKVFGHQWVPVPGCKSGRVRRRTHLYDRGRGSPAAGQVTRSSREHLDL